MLRLAHGHDLKMRARLASPAIGLSDLRFVRRRRNAEHHVGNGALLSDPTVAPYVQVFAGHQYSQFDLSAEDSRCNR